MKTAGIVLLCCALLLGVFAWWGIYTDSGRRRFDEMAGMIPMGAGAVAVVALLVGIVLIVLARR